MNVQVFGLSLQSIYFGENMKFDKSKYKRYFLAILIVGALSAIYSYLIASDATLTLQFSATNMAIAAVGGLNLILQKRV